MHLKVQVKTKKAAFHRWKVNEVAGKAALENQGSYDVAGKLLKVVMILFESRLIVVGMLVQSRIEFVL